MMMPTDQARQQAAERLSTTPGREEYRIDTPQIQENPGMGTIVALAA
jgi:hypothetical protein